MNTIKTAVFALVFVVAYGLFSAPDAVASSGAFLDVFTQAQSKDTLTAAASNFVFECCRKRDDALRMLKENGFTITLVSEPTKVAELNKRWKTTEDAYDEFVLGQRGTTLWRFWDVFAWYRVVFFLKQGTVARVWADSSDNLPLP